MNHYNAPTYKSAREVFQQVHKAQIAKGAAKYPEPLTPENWAAHELIQHALEEAIDLIHYLTALKMKLEGITDESVPEKRNGDVDGSREGPRELAESN